jgi:hypothetical protein
LCTFKGIPLILLMHEGEMGLYFGGVMLSLLVCVQLLDVDSYFNYLKYTLKMKKTYTSNATITNFSLYTVKKA